MFLLIIMLMDSIIIGAFAFYVSKGILGNRNPLTRLVNLVICIAAAVGYGILLISIYSISNYNVFWSCIVLFSPVGFICVLLVATKLRSYLFNSNK